MKFFEKAEKRTRIKSKGFFFVRTTLQYLCACEGCVYFKEKYEDVELVVLNSHLSLINQIKRIIDDNMWDNVVYERIYRFTNKNKLLVVIGEILQLISIKLLLVRYLFKIKQDDFVFIGNLNEVCLQWLLEKSISKNKIILDDGLATLGIVESIRNNGYILRCEVGMLPFIYSILFYKNKIDVKSYVFFTFLNGIDCSPAKYIYNNLSWMKETFKRDNYENKKIVLFVGQPLVRLGIISTNDYVQVINSIKNYYENNEYEFQYCFHKSEDLSVLPEGLNLKNYEYSIEVELLKSFFLPEIIISFSSTAIVTIKLLFGEQIQVICIKPTFNVNNNGMDLVYRYLEKNINMGISFKESSDYDG